jgi:geranylgeranyl pyrophosphate synthase
VPQKLSKQAIREELKSVLVARTSNSFLTSSHFLNKYFGSFEKARFCTVLGSGLQQPRETSQAIGFSAELLMAAELILDDILDNDGERGGIPTLHISHGVDEARFVSDEITSIALGLASKVSRAAGRRMRRAQLLLRKGQAMSMVQGKGYPTPRYVIQTAKYRAGFLMSNAFACLVPEELSSDQRRSVRLAGLLVGTCMQLHNDLRNVDCQEGTDTSRYLSDLTQGQVNIVVSYALEGSSNLNKDLKQLVKIARTVQSNPSEFDSLMNNILFTKGVKMTAELLAAKTLLAVKSFATVMPDSDLSDVLDICEEIVA